MVCSLPCQASGKFVQVFLSWGGLGAFRMSRKEGLGRGGLPVQEGSCWPKQQLTCDLNTFHFPQASRTCETMW